METTEPMTEEQMATSLLEPIEQETEIETDGETQEIETEDVDDETDDDAPDDGGDEDTEETDDSEEETDEGDDEEPDNDDSESEPLETVKVNGEERKVTKQELKNDYAGRAALQQRHTELKAQEEQIQQYAATMQQERQQLLQLMQQAQENGFKAPPAKPDPAMMQSDPIGYMEAKAAYDQQFEAYQEEQKTLSYQQQLAQRQAEQQRQMAVQQQREILLQEMPELSDPEKGKALQKAWTDTAKAYGFSGEELAAVEDARTFKMLDDARKWRELQAGKQAAKQPRKEAKPVTRPKGKPRTDGMEKRQKDIIARAKRTQSDADWALSLLE